MRIKSMITTVTAVTALLTLTACGGDGSESPALGGISGGNEGVPQKNGGADGSAPKSGTGFKGLPKAGSMAGAARLINGFTKCDQVSPEKNSSEAPDAKYGATFSVTERGYCGRRNVTSIFMIKDPKAFQTAYKAEVDKGEEGGNVNSGPIIGQDFATGSESEEAMSALLSPQSGLLMLNCHAGFNPPSGYRKEPALVKGCVLTDYYKD
ncbi:hypothetical protein [Streptomyces sp. NPDC048269]|uniref:hypothetical protein n=1 Tax=Streptomyces sp. NPDC048269 TaxID=3155753 RepID=UPI0034310067